jgi:hypothetical protein
MRKFELHLKYAGNREAGTGNHALPALPVAAREVVRHA